MVRSIIHPTLGIPIHLGALPKKTDARTLKLSKYLRAVEPGQLPPPPDQVNWFDGLVDFLMGGNDKIGCCVPVAAANTIRTWTYRVLKKFGLGSVVNPTEAQILKAYEDVGGYRPGNPSTDQGCALIDFLKYWVNTGIGGNKILAFAEVDPRNLAEREIAIALFGPLFSALDLPLSAQSQIGKVWDVPQGGPVGNGYPGTWGGHCVPIGQYGQTIDSCVTWSKDQQLTRAFEVAYLSECYAVLSKEWLATVNGDQIAPSGFDLAALQSDLAIVQQTTEDDYTNPDNYSPIPPPSPPQP